MWQRSDPGRGGFSPAAARRIRVNATGPSADANLGPADPTVSLDLGVTYLYIVAQRPERLDAAACIEWALGSDLAAVPVRLGFHRQRFGTIRVLSEESARRHPPFGAFAPA